MNFTSEVLSVRLRKLLRIHNRFSIANGPSLQSAVAVKLRFFYTVKILLIKLKNGGENFNKR